jgi:putative flippase GtrA
MGIAVQLFALFILNSRLGLHYMLATALAVEAAVLHNLVWHERWTWADRTQMPGGFIRRACSFHLANGAMSLAGNLVLMRIFTGALQMNPLAANILAIAICSLLNFLAGDRIVFKPSGAAKSRRAVEAVLFAAAFLSAGGPTAEAADLQPETLNAWNAAVSRAERRIAAELASNKGFLTLDFQDPATAARERKALLSGSIPVSGGAARVPDGMIHHWKGSMFIPGVALDFVLSRVERPKPEDTRQEDVLESRIMETGPGQLRMFLKLQRSKIVTVVYNTEHLVRYRRHGNARASSSSVATRIAEVENYRKNDEREKPEGHDSGYLWRMNSYWRYEEVKGGVIVECESLTLSRSVPSLLEPMIRPLINRVARESMNRTLASMRGRMARGWRVAGSQAEVRNELPTDADVR